MALLRKPLLSCVAVVVVVDLDAVVDAVDTVVVSASIDFVGAIDDVLGVAATTTLLWRLFKAPLSDGEVEQVREMLLVMVLTRNQ